MNETTTRDLAAILGDIEAHKKHCEAAHVPANAETLLRLVLEAVPYLGTLKSNADLAQAQAIEAQRMALDAADIAQRAADKAAKLAHELEVRAVRDIKPAAKKAPAKKAA